MVLQMVLNNPLSKGLNVSVGAAQISHGSVMFSLVPTSDPQEALKWDALGAHYAAVDDGIMIDM